MSIDVKTLRIGSHVLVGGQRVRVCGITQRKIGYHATGKPCEHLHYARLNEVEPISITPSLLKELGFEDCAKKRWHTEDWEKRWGECQYLSFTKLYRGEWRVHYFDGAKDRGQTVVRYLHEAEAFLALHGVELIKE
jgi:hypothetical protein